MSQGKVGCVKGEAEQWGDGVPVSANSPALAL